MRVLLARHRGGCNFTSFLRLFGPFFMQRHELFLPQNLHPHEGNPSETLLDFRTVLHPEFSEVSKRGWREGVGDKQEPQKTREILQKCVPLLLRRHRKKSTERGLNVWHMKDCLAPTPSVPQPLFETSEFQIQFHTDFQTFFWAALDGRY